MAFALKGGPACVPLAEPPKAEHATSEVRSHDGS